MPLGPIWKLRQLSVVTQRMRQSSVVSTVLCKRGRTMQPVTAQGGATITVAMTSLVVVVKEVVNVVVVGNVSVTRREVTVEDCSVTIMAGDGVMKHEHALLTLLAPYSETKFGSGHGDG